MKKLLHLRHYLLIGLVSIILCFGNKAMAAAISNTWQGGVVGHQTEWSYAGNWSTGVAPVSGGGGDNVTIPSGLTYYPVLTANSACRNITLMGNGASIGGSSYTLTISDKSGIVDVTGIANISCSISMVASSVIGVTGTLTISGVISGSATTLTKDGTGELILTGNNTYSGKNVIKTGTLSVPVINNWSSGSGSPLGQQTTSALGQIDLGNSNTATLKYTGSGHSSNRVIALLVDGTTIDASGGGALTLSGGVTGVFNLILKGTGSASQNGVIATGTGSTLTKNGTGTWTLSNANTYTGVTTVSDGTLIAGANVPSNTNSPFGKATTAIVLGDAATTTNKSSPTLLNGGAFTMARPITVANQSTSGQYSIGGSTDNTSTFSGAITINQPLTVSQIATTSTNTLNITGGITTGNAGTKNVTFDNAGSVSIGTTAITKGTGDIALIKQNAGTLTLATTNTFTAGSTLSTGTLNINNSQALGTVAGTFIINGGTIDNTTSGAITTLNYPQTWGGDFAFTGTKDLNFGTGAVSMSAARQVTVNGGILTEGGIISGSGFRLTKAGSGTLTLSGVNTFTGGTTLSTGTLNINNSQALGTEAGTFIINGGTIDNTTGSAITTLNYPHTWGGDFVFTGFKDLNLGTGAVTLGADRQVTVNAGTLTIGGAMSAPAFSVTKAGGGTLALGANAVTISGLTISAGALISTSGTLSLAGNYSNSGTFTHNGGTVVFNGATQTIAGGTTTLNNLTLSSSTSTTLNVNTSVAGNLSVTSGIFDLGAFSCNRTSSGGSLALSASTMLKIGGTSTTFPSNFSTVTLPTSSTVEYYGTTQTPGLQSYGNLTLSGTGTMGSAALASVTGNLLMSGTSLSYINTGQLAIGGNLTINTSNTFAANYASIPLNVTGKTDIYGIASSSQAGKTFTGDFTVYTGGSWTEGSNPTYNFGGSVTNNTSSTFNLGAGTINFTGLGKTIGGTNAISIATGSFSGTYTNKGIVTVSSTLSGSGTLTQGANSTLNIGGSSGTAILTAIASGNTVNYTSTSSQTIIATDYYNLNGTGGDRSLPATGTVGVAGAFTPGSGTYTTTGSTINFNGSTNQNIPPFTFNNLTASNTAGLTLTGNTTVNGILNFNTDGLITTGTNTLIMGASGSITGYNLSRYVSGKLAMTYIAAGFKIFPIGKEGNYRPLTLNYTALEGLSSTAIVEQFESEMPGGTLDPATIWKSRYWTISESGSSSRTYYVTLDGTGFSPTHKKRMIKGDGSTNSAYDATFSSPYYTNTTAFTSFSNFGLGETNYKTSATDGSWNTAETWLPVGVPILSDDVMVDHAVIVDNTASCKNLTINSGKSLTINAGKVLTVDGTLTNSAENTGLVIKSASSQAGGTASLINASSGVPATVERYLSGGIWHLISSAVSSQGISNFLTTPGNGIDNKGITGGTKYAMAPYNNGTDDWDYFLSTNLSGYLSVGTGYEVLRKGNGIVSFKGSLDGGDINASIGNSGNAWNLLGNPFPCAIDIKQFITDNGANMRDSYIGVYVADLANNATGAYKLINNTSDDSLKYLSASEAFFVKAIATGSPTVNFSKNYKTSNVPIFRGASIPYPDITLSAENGTQKLTTSVKYIAGMTTGLDPGWDGGLFNGDGVPPFSLFTRLVQDNGVDFSIQCLPDNNYDNLVIPVGLVAAKGSTVAFKAEALNLPSGYKVYLEDKVAAKVTLLDGAGSNYTVVLNADSQGTGRFYLRTAPIISAVPDELTNELTVIPLPQQQIIRLLGTVNLPACAMIYDMTGRLITTKSLTGISDNEIPLINASSGVYLIKIDSKTTPVSKKVSWITD